MIIEPKDGFDDPGVTSRQQTRIVRLSIKADDECAILTSAPTHMECLPLRLPNLCRGVCQRFDKARQLSALFTNQDLASSTP